MPKISPFQATRYAEGVPLDKVTCPPYDVISDQRLAELRASDVRNFVHALVPDPRGSLDPATYETCAEHLHNWLDDGTLTTDEEPHLYVYGADYHLAGNAHSSRGIVGSLQLETFGEGGIFPHENTTPGPKQDRLMSMRATGFNLEPLWFFSSRPVPGFTELIGSADQRAPVGDVTDLVGVRHRIWQCDPSTSKQISDSIANVPIVVADGHHRYETALTFRDEMRAALGPGPWDETIALISDPVAHPPTVLGIHRVVRTTIEEVAKLVEIDACEEQAVSSAADLMAQVERRGPGTVGVLAPSGSYLLKTSGDLDTTFLAEKILGPLGLAPIYEHDLSEVQDHVASGAVAFLLNAPSLQRVADMALSGQRMPPKTTLFWPKPLSGLVLRNLREGRESGVKGVER